ncbi:MAG: TIGR03915 family putative DNA repair protein [Lachnospiraceae bacterium]|nr:TIGR03915 family putative DNA repair protein [Lachnospiraceae bacterium]
MQTELENAVSKPIRVYQCENSIEGILSGIYQAWSKAYGHKYIRLSVPDLEESANLEFFCEYFEVTPIPEQAEKVAGTIRNRISVKVYETMIHALLSNRPDKADAVYHMLVGAFRYGESILEHLAEPAVQAVFEMNRYVGNEAHLYNGFLRFEESVNGVMLARFQPINDLLEVVTPHFENRFSRENFIIYDTGRQKAAFHRAGYPFVVREVTEAEMQQFMHCSERELQFQQFWQTFFETIAIAERENPKLQRNMMPLHYRKYMTEFKKRGEKNR